MGTDAPATDDTNVFQIALPELTATRATTSFITKWIAEKPSFGIGINRPKPSTMRIGVHIWCQRSPSTFPEYAD